MIELPTYGQYKTQVDHLVSRGELTTEQGVVLISVFRNHLSGNPTHINYLMQATGLDWKPINWLLNGLVMKGGIRKIDKYYYTI